MSTTNNIKLLLDIQDENIFFEGLCVNMGTFKGKTCKFVEGKLTYIPTHCKHCGVKNENYIIYKNGTQISRITLPSSGLHPVYLLLKKQRFLCKACNGSFTAKTPIVGENCNISEYTKAQVLIKVSDAQSLTMIARDCSVSCNTVQRVIDKEANNFKTHHHKLPKHLSFDEFKYAKGMMAFEYINAETGEILDILEQRQGRIIKDHFIANYCLKDRKQVETITIDMNAGYVNVIKELFPNAKIIIDRFHLVQLINRSMNKCRIRVMNRFKTSNNEDMKKYRRIKRYWKLLLKNGDDLSIKEYKKYPLFGQWLESEVVNDILNYDEELKVNYTLYQCLLRAMKKRDFKAFQDVFQMSYDPLVSNYMKTSLKTLKKHLPYIKHSFTYKYNNGRIEGTNNKIKVLNRVAYGYRNFWNYRSRIILHFKYKPINKQNTKAHSNVA